jgi:hypothetical protein
MRKAEAQETPTLSQVVHRAVEVCDPAGSEEGPADLLRRLEDRDEPVTAAGDVEQQIAEAKGAIDPQDEDPVTVMTAAVATYLAFKRTEMERDRADLLVLAARAEWDGNPPQIVSDWLARQGVQL